MLLRLRELVRRLRGEQGFTMINVTIVSFAVMGISAGAFAATGSDLRIGIFDRSSKQAYAAAEAGIAEYLSKVNSDNAYWRLCANRPAVPPHIGQRWDGTAPDPRAWRGVPDSNAEYTIELLPANGASACNTGDANGTMLDGRTGAFQIRVTGRVRQGGRTEGKRSLIATFKRTSFLEFLYFTDYETSDPIVKEIQTYGKITRPRIGYQPDRPAPSLPVWASENCDSYYREGRDALRWYRGDNVDQPDSTRNNTRDGNLDDDGFIYWPDTNGANEWKEWSGSCGRIQFGDSDKVEGPLHTNDELNVCGTPEFGRSGRNDRIEITSPNAFIKCNSSASPVVRGDLQTRATNLEPPPDNGALKTEVLPGYLFTGQTTIDLQPDQLLVNGVPKPYPPNGVIYVDSAQCGQEYRPLTPYSVPVGCGDAYVKGAYNKDLTIAAAKDIVVTGDITRQNVTPKPDVTLGLIANGFVRVEHKLRTSPPGGPHLDVSYRTGNPTCDNLPGQPLNRTIDAAILALQHSFIVDHYYCGGRLGTLTVFGVIAQKYRGPVGTSSNAVITNGYEKNYQYDDRLSLRQPPYFLDPVRSAWRLRRQTEQTPAR
jgi:hypothetical protein